MKLNKLISVLQSHADEMGDVEVRVILEDYKRSVAIEDVDFGYHIASVNDTEATVPFVHILPCDDYERGIFFPIPQEICPYCGDEDIANEGPPDDFHRLEITCHGCGCQWNEDANYPGGYYDTMPKEQE